MSADRKLKLVDEIFESQPNLLASVLALGVRKPVDERIDLVLQILLLCFESVRAAGIQLPTVSEEVQEVCLSRLVAQIRATEGLSPKRRSQIIERQLADHDEPFLLSLVLMELRENRLTGADSDEEKFLVLSALNLAASIARVMADASAGSSRSPGTDPS
jgi:hypothetical protein